jgi:hypothetical protein
MGNFGCSHSLHLQGAAQRSRSAAPSLPLAGEGTRRERSERSASAGARRLERVGWSASAGARGWAACRQMYHCLTSGKCLDGRVRSFESCPAGRTRPGRD